MLDGEIDHVDMVSPDAVDAARRFHEWETGKKMADQKLERCTATVTNGIVSATYRWEGNDRDGGIRHDEDVSTWTDGEIRDAIAALIGAEEKEDVEKIEVVWD